MTYEAFIARFEKRTATARGVQVRCPAHEDKQASMSVGRGRDGGVVVKCFAGCSANDIVAAMGLGLKDLYAKELERPTNRIFDAARLPVAQPPSPVKPQIEAIYSYTNALGVEVYQAVRLKPKSFRQRHKNGADWTWSMDGVERVLYKLPEVMKATEVWVVEGEKDADNLVKLGLCATTNIGGAGKWLDGYTEALAGKDVIICGDNDEPGQKHVQLVFKSVSTKARTVKMVRVPQGHKDVSDLIAANNGGSDKSLRALVNDAVPHVGGVRMPVYSMADMQAAYHRQVTLPEGMRVNLGAWLPSLRAVRPLLPGEIILFVGDTGVGKTMILQNLIMAFPLIPSLLFELELPQEMMFERFVAIKLQATCIEVEQNFRDNGLMPVTNLNKHFANLYVCPESRLTPDQFEAVVTKAELKMGTKPVLVALDYAQLMQGKGNSRYERASDVAESLKVVAKATGTIIAVASQVDRASAKAGDIGIHSGKDSGSLENSAGVVVACKRDEKDESLLYMKVVKSTKGGAGTEVLCNINGAMATITERSKIQEGDVPRDRRNSEAA